MTSSPPLPLHPSPSTTLFYSSPKQIPTNFFSSLSPTPRLLPIPLSLRSGPPLYLLIVADIPSTPSSSSSNSKSSSPSPPSTSIIIVPYKNSNDFIFTHIDGITQLAQQISCSRIIFIKLPQPHSQAAHDTRTNDDISNDKATQKIKSDLTPLIKGWFPGGGKIPYLTMGTEAEEGAARDDDDEEEEAKDLTVLSTIPSSYNGPLVVESYTKQNDSYRRLRFQSTGFIQSECRMMKSNKEHVNYGYLPTDYHRGIISSLSFYPFLSYTNSKTGTNSSPITPINILQIGLGAGNIDMFIRHVLRNQFNMTIIEIDQQVVDIAKQWFQWTQQDHLKDPSKDSKDTTDKVTLIIADGIPTLHSMYQDRLILTKPSHHHDDTSSTHGVYSTRIPSSPPVSPIDILIIDCNSSDLSTGLSFPPQPFLSATFLISLHYLLSPGGCIIYNYGCRNSRLTWVYLWRLYQLFVLETPLNEQKEREIEEKIMKGDTIDMASDTSNKSKVKGALVGRLCLESDEINEILVVRKGYNTDVQGYEGTEKVATRGLTWSKGVGEGGQFEWNPMEMDFVDLMKGFKEFKPEDGIEGLIKVGSSMRGDGAQSEEENRKKQKIKEKRAKKKAKQKAKKKAGSANSATFTGLEEPNQKAIKEGNSKVSESGDQRDT